MLEGKKVNIKLGGDFEPVPMDKYTVQISDVTLVTQFNSFKGVEEEMLNYQFTILDDKPMPEGEETTRGRLLWQRCSLSMGSKSKLGKLAKAALGKDMTKEEMEAFDPESLVGLQVDVMVNQNPSKDGTKVYNNIVEVSKNIKPLPVVEAQTVKGSQPVQKKTVPVVAPDATDPDEFIGGLEKEAKVAKSKAAAPAEVAPADEVDEEAEAAEAELKAAELAAKAARARAEAAKKKAAMASA